MWTGPVDIVGNVGVVLPDQALLFAMRTSLVDLAAVGVMLADQGYSDLFVLRTPLADVAVVGAPLTGSMNWVLFRIGSLLRDAVAVGVEDTSEQTTPRRPERRKRKHQH